MKEYIKNPGDFMTVEEAIASLLKNTGPQIGLRIKEQRKKMKLNQSEVAKILNMSIIEFKKVELGKRAINFEKSVILAIKLNSTVDWLIGGKE
jgi:transcriptional regulator with XRE-family HTH domain